MAVEEFWDGAVPWVSAKDMKTPRLHDSMLHVSEKAIGNGTRLAQTGAVLIVVRGMILAHSLPVARAERPIAFNQDIKALTTGAEVDSEFMLHWLRANSQQILGIATESTHGTKRIQTDDLFAVPVALPALSEQRAIAKALNDVDALLAGLDRLIAKKRDLKQAAMQQLLTGSVRLPGFADTWATTSISELAEIVSGGTPATGESTYWNGDIKWCTPTDITASPGKYLRDTARSISALGLRSSGARLLPAGALLLCSRATIGELKIAAYEVCTNQGFKSLLCRPHVNNEFLYYKLLTMKAQMIERAFGSTFLEISTANVATLALAVPSLQEQSAIAEVLSGMDEELVMLEARRDKTRTLKQAMMQELLTGRIRLI